MSTGAMQPNDAADYILAAKALVDAKGPNSWTAEDQSTAAELLDAAERSYLDSLEAERKCSTAVADATAAGTPLNPALRAAIEAMRGRNENIAAKLAPLLQGRPLAGHTN